MDKDIDLFDNIINQLVFDQGSVDVGMLVKDSPKGTFIVLDQSDRLEGDVNVRVYKIEDKAMFINRLQDRLGEENIDPTDEDTVNVIWEELNRHIEVEFDEY